MSVQEITSKSQFDKFTNNGKKDSVIDYMAQWCGPCKVVGPQFEAMAKQYPAVQFGRVDVDAVQEVASAQSVTAMPTFVIYDKNGKEKGRVVGADINAVKKHLGGSSGTSKPSTGYVLGTGKKVSSEPMSESTQQLIILAAFALVLGYFYYFK